MSGFPVFLAVVHDSIRCGYRPFRVVTFEEHEVDGRFDEAFAKHSEIPTCLTRALDSRREILDAPASCELPAGLARLRNLEQCVATSEDISHAHIAPDRTMQCEVFAKRTVGKASGEIYFPLVPMVFWVGAHGFVRASMMFEIGLTISLEVGQPK